MSVAAVLPAATAAGRDAAAVVRRRVLAPTTAVFLAAAIACGVLDVARIGIPLPVQLLPFAASVLLFGLPHGALDHLVPARLDPAVPVARSVLVVVALYLVLGGATAAIWLASPVTGFVLFVLVTWYHWGQGDLWIARAVERDPGDRADDALTLLVRGGLPMLVPLAVHPGAYTSVLAATSAVVGPARAAAPAPGLRLAAGALLVALVAAQLALRAVRRRPLTTGLAETAVLALFFVAVPAILAVGLYFALWHSVRHIVRLELADPVSRTALAAGGLMRPLLRFLRDAWPTTLAAIVLLAALALASHRAGLGVYLVLIAALTTPHALVVTWMDARWRLARRSGVPLPAPGATRR